MEHRRLCCGRATPHRVGGCEWLLPVGGRRVPGISRDVEEFEILAYRLWPTSYDEDGQGTVRERDATLGSATQVDVSGWERIGFDVVATDGFDTLRDGIHRFLATVQPPLFPNCYCLVDDLESAIAIAETFAASGGVEPGRYLVFDVLR